MVQVPHLALTPLSRKMHPNRPLDSVGRFKQVVWIKCFFDILQGLHVFSGNGY